MTQRKVRIGVVGTGWWATCTHLPALTARPEVDLVALCDRDPERLRLSAEAFHVGKTYTDFRRMLARERLDGVVVATAQPAHYEVAQTALVAGCHLLCEKPMVLSVSHAQELIELANRQGRAIVMSYPWNYTAHTQRARQAVPHRPPAQREGLSGTARPRPSLRSAETHSSCRNTVQRSYQAPTSKSRIRRDTARPQLGHGVPISGRDVVADPCAMLRP